VFESQAAYGLVWVKLQASNNALPVFPESARPDLNQVLCGPYVVKTAAPRVVENFLDMAHFGFVHEGILGDAQHTEVANYQVEQFDDARGQGIVALNCRAWQPQSNIKAAQGQWVDYTYRVNAALTAILTKRPANQNMHEAIALFVQPQTEETSVAWVVLALSIWDQTAEQLRAFQDTIFAQDLKILESQTPKKLPLVAGYEVPQAADKMSAAYRRYLLEQKMDYGVIRNEPA
jgi:phenylpropionate dioxygenase-like ring-hydroxylating dioxygenase large terminal subunit